MPNDEGKTVRNTLPMPLCADDGTVLGAAGHPGSEKTLVVADDSREAQFVGEVQSAESEVEARAESRPPTRAMAAGRVAETDDAQAQNAQRG
jgi:hypothetical protein